MTRHRVAVVGAGPAGAYAAAQLLASRHRPEVDVFERLPTPWGLLRGGVAPDHQEIKRLAVQFDSDVLRPGCRFFGNVEVGRDLGHDDLVRHYSAVVYAVGARTGNELGVPGEDLPGSIPATAFVGWYNGHPDHRDVAPDLGVRRVVIVGNGNVAADVARILTRSVDELARTDIADHALEALRRSTVEEVVVLGRRGPAQAAFSSSELAELGHLDGVDVTVPLGEVTLDEVSQEWLERDGTFTARQNVGLLRAYAQRPSGTGVRRRVTLRFLRSPHSINGNGRVESVDAVRNELVRWDDGSIRARATGDIETIECGLVLRSVGYRAVPLPGVPFDERRFVLPNDRGRVLDASSGALLRGVYAVGWIKRGPTGILGTNKRDARETVDCVLADLDAGVLLAPAESEAVGIEALLADRAARLVTVDGWRSIDASEVRAGTDAGRPRVKFATVDALLEAAQ